MAQAAKTKRKKDEPERINLDQWGNAGALDGLLSFLNIAPDQAPVNQGPCKVLNLLEERSPQRTKTSESGTVSTTGTLPVIEASNTEATLSGTAKGLSLEAASLAKGSINFKGEQQLTSRTPVTKSRLLSHCDGRLYLKCYTHAN
jgi:hypothetical protein